MVAARQILDTFLRDSWRMSESALLLLSACEADWAAGRPVEVPQVRQLFQWIHTMKGTACMIRDALPIVEALQEVEGRLTVQSLEASAKGAGAWMPAARGGLELTRRELEKLRAALSQGALSLTNAPSGPLAPIEGALGMSCVVSGEQVGWVGLDRFVEVLSPWEVTARSMILRQGRWVPVLTLTSGSEAFGVLMKDARGLWVAAVEGVIGVESWRRARLRAARPLDRWIGEESPASSSVSFSAAVKKVA
jgi:hypothetical protein